MILFFSKALLRHPLARSNLSDFTGDSHFQWVIPDAEHGKTIVAPEECRRVVICSGQVFANLHKHRATSEINDVAIIRVEQLHPFPWAELRSELDKFTNVKEIVWAQEEPLNAGSWTYVQPRLDTVLRSSEVHAGKHVKYAGRPPSASVATGNKKTHIREENELLEAALGQGELA